MATNRPNLGLQIALIIFVLITIALAVSTFMFFKDSQEARMSEKSAVEKAAKAQDETNKIDKELDKLKTIVGKGHQDKVDTIVGEFKEDMKTVGGAALLEPAQTYPTALSVLLKSYMKLQEDVVDLKAQHEKLKDDNRSFIALKDKIQAEFNVKSEAQVADIIAQRKLADAERARYEDDRGGLARKIEEKTKAIVEQEQLASKEKKNLTAAIAEQGTQLNQVKNEMREIKKEDFEAPDGHVIRVNQRDRTVWIDKGFADGLKRQTTFAIYEKDVSNVNGKTAKPKGTIEVIDLLEEHKAVARITDDSITNPILEEDKIMSKTFMPGQPQHFAVVGAIDLDGDGQSDLKQLLTLIGNNGGVVDAMVDETGKRSGLVTPTLKAVIIGDRTAEGAQSAEAAQATNRLLKEAEDQHVNTIPLSDYLKMNGYEGRERTVPLGGKAPPPKKPAGDSDSTFRKRP